MAAPRGNKFASRERKAMTPLQRFLSYCRFEPATGCVVWIGGVTMGRGHHVPYGSFWFEGSSWYAHRWSAQYIHGLDIDDLQVDHCCPNIPIPNTLCVGHVQCLTLGENRELQHVRQYEARKRAIHLQVGILQYEDIYGPLYEPDLTAIPFYSPPAWLGATHDHSHRAAAAHCPF